ncbi:MAG: T9SS type A sorting domain-containing protein [Sporocytophaga sp.]|uniref:T9SS type A sorting domain-containing protein n=1 Tax=Sporocytophaga sp. TaxID=2231183 RepID=UPI001B01EA34|nr:T9SS type A sorting domain-containing protein [Sporocytophaga sp.]MBO9698684.1 T9SS type A sorting domain-containing protein [Sporocytophaga sp.]
MKFIPALALSLISYIGYGQSISPSVINSTGNIISGGGFSLEYSVGEVAVSTIGNGNFIVTEGVLQPEFAVVSSNPVKLDAVGPKYIFDRPNSELYIISSEEISSIEVFDIKGNKVCGTANTTFINLRQLSDGLYLVFYKDHKESINYFKLVK